MALNFWLALALFALLVGSFLWVLIWAKNCLMNFIDRNVPCICKFAWLDAVEAEIKLTDGTILRGAGGLWKLPDGKMISDIGLRIALRRRYEEEATKVIKSAAKEE